MNTITVRDLRTEPRKARAALGRGEEAVLTVHGRPVALLIPVDAASLEETSRAIRRARALLALEALRCEARAKGLDRLSLKQIDGVVAETRRAGRRPPRTKGR